MLQLNSRTHFPNRTMARWMCLSLTLWAAVAWMGAGAAQGKKKKKTRVPPPPPADVPGHVKYLALQLTYLPLDESAPITSQIQTLVVDHLKEWLANHPKASDVDVRRELEYDFAQLHYPFVGQPAVFSEPWNGAELIGAGYTLGWAEYNRVNVVALFERRAGKSSLVGLTNFVPWTDLHYEILHQPELKDFRFIVYGFRPGKSQLRLSAIMYSFGDQSLKSLWEAHDVYDGKMQVDHGKVILRYLREDEYVSATGQGRKPPRHEAIYQTVPQGLELQTEREIPF